MQVAQVNSSAASTLGQTPAEDSSSRADDFARVLQTAFYGKGSEAVAKSTERAVSDAAPRTETRIETRRDTRSETRQPERISYERAEPAETRRSDDTAPRRDAATRETRPTDRQSSDQATAEKAPAKTEAKPVAKDAAAAGDTGQTEDAAPQDAVQETAQPTEQSTAPDTDEATGTAETELPEDATQPVVVAAPDALLILSLLQTPAVATPAAAMASTETPVVAAPVAVPTVPAVSPLDAAAALAAVTEAMQGETPVPVEADAAAAKTVAAAAAVVPAAPQPAVTDPAAVAMAKTATDTSAAALLSQQQTVTPEDFAVIQQALTAQTQIQTQAQAQAGKPAVVAETAPKTEPRADKTLTVDIQGAATPVAAKTLVDQASLFAMQGDEDQAAADAALQQQQTLTAQQAQPDGPELKFNAALLQANAEAPLQGTAASAAAGSQTPQHQVAAMSGTGAPAVQAAQHAATHAATRHLNAYIPADEQVALQIKKGAAEGIDKISIKLDPGNLGKVEVKLEVTHDGRLMAVISADKPETLQMLQQEAGKLEQSLRDAGLKTDQQSLSFSLRDQGQANEGRDGTGAGNGRQRNRGGDDYAETGLRTDPAQVAAANAQRAAAARGGLDIRI